MAKKGPSLDKSRFGIGNNNDDSVAKYILHDVSR